MGGLPQRQRKVGLIVLPFPDSALAGHHDKHWGPHGRTKAKHRKWAYNAGLAAKPALPEEGDIRIHFRFIPPNNRGDRLNYPNRIKPYADGLADAWKINDKRFLPSYEFCDPEKPGRLEIEVMA